jgi:hypothetical protein
VLSLPILAIQNKKFCTTQVNYAQRRVVSKSIVLTQGQSLPSIFACPRPKRGGKHAWKKRAVAVPGYVAGVPCSRTSGTVIY